MNWLNIKKTDNESENTFFPEKTSYLYLIGILSGITIFSFFPGITAPGDTLLYLGFFLNLGIGLWGITKTLEINQAGDNRDYLKRFISLSLAVGIKLMVCLIVFSVLLRVSKTFFEWLYPSLVNGQLMDGTSKLLLTASVSLLFFMMLTRSFKRINEATAA